METEEGCVEGKPVGLRLASWPFPSWLWDSGQVTWSPCASAHIRRAGRMQFLAAVVRVTL